MQKTRVIYVAFDVFPSPKGSSTHMAHVLQGLADSNFYVDVVTPGEGNLPAEEELYGARIYRVPGNPEDHFLRRALAFGEAVLTHVHQNQAYQVAHFRSVWGGLQLAQFRHVYGYKTIFEVNGLPSIEMKYHYPALAGNPLLEKVREQERAALALSDAILCPSGVTRLFLGSLGAQEHKITVIPNGVSPNDFPATPIPPRSKERIPTLLYIGTLAEWQGLDILIQAMPAILENHPARLRIVGRGRSWQRKTLAKQIRKAGLEAHIAIEEAVPHHQVAGLLAEADICLAPLSLNDRNITQGCCPIKVIEYMAAGRPLVASNLPVVRELVREGVDGMLFIPNDPVDLARQVVVLLQDSALSERLASSAAQRARQSFTWHLAQKKLDKVYRRLLRESASA
jgi:glycosyltransferase involved in cell wall biosynthesis